MCSAILARMQQRTSAQRERPRNNTKIFSPPFARAGHRVTSTANGRGHVNRRAATPHGEQKFLDIVKKDMNKRNLVFSLFYIDYSGSEHIPLATVSHGVNSYRALPNNKRALQKKCAKETVVPGGSTDCVSRLRPRTDRSTAGRSLKPSPRFLKKGLCYLSSGRRVDPILLPLSLHEAKHKGPDTCLENDQNVALVCTS